MPRLLPTVRCFEDWSLLTLASEVLGFSMDVALFWKAGEDSSTLVFLLTIEIFASKKESLVAENLLENVISLRVKPPSTRL